MDKPSDDHIEEAVDTLYALAKYVEETEPQAIVTISDLHSGASAADALID